MKNKKNKCWLLLYDDDCSFCKRFAAIIEKYGEGLIQNFSLQQHYKQYGNIPIEQLLEDVHLLGKNGEILRGGDAVNKVISLVPEARPFRWLIESRWGKKGTNIFYSVIKKFRHCSKCMKKNIYR
jgi:predicted DCC family thiol-disulfide oxidoreductase YuxK